MKSFAELFKKYRLRAEFETFSSFGDALSEKGYYYDDSIFSHWQKGTRTPKDRKLLLKILEIFAERDSIKTLDQANEFLSSAGLGYMTEHELIHFSLLHQSIFQLPDVLEDFTGREKALEMILDGGKKGETIHIYMDLLVLEKPQWQLRRDIFYDMNFLTGFFGIDWIIQNCRIFLLQLPIS